MWRHARPDLSDLRIYSAEKEIPYVLTTEWGGSETERKNIRVLQSGIAAGKTQFLLDMAGIAEYDRIELKLSTKNFVAHANVEGQDDPHGAHWTNLGTTTLYDLSEEKLGRNSMLQIPGSTYKYLRVTVTGAVTPSEVESATAAITRAQKSVWRDLSSQPKQDQKGRDTVFVFPLVENVPAERVIFTINPTQNNFVRELEIRDAKEQYLQSGELKRIHMQRNGQKIDVEQMSVDLHSTGPGILKVMLHNGDDLPLKNTGVRLQQYERRIYFNADAGTLPTVYYGDEKLPAPVYDYARLFEKDARAAQVQLSAEEANAAYTGRPDDRPWSERHPAVLWGAIIAAVLILGGIAIRSMKMATA
ncbi:MAG TPA: DUF3999 family protein [Candidatus Dormibacteraeota bacterium]|nr:DUF3999 family protein [Candidatus Dormibacteraeota bacterium]